MKFVKPVELFLTLGLVATLGACGSPGGEGGENEAVTTSAPTEQTAAPSSEGGEGGEGGEKADSGDAAVDYATTLSLMLGHLMVAEELLAAGESVQAESHLGHPADELYGDVAAALGDRGVADFKPDLDALSDLVKSDPKAPVIQDKLQEVIKKIDAAIAVLGDDKLKSPEFVMAVVNGLLKVAGQEYAAAIADGKIVEAVEYQDSRGFVFHSEMLYNSIADQLSPESQATISAAFKNLKAAWPTVTPPATPVKTPQEVLGYIVEIEAGS